MLTLYRQTTDRVSGFNVNIVPTNHWQGERFQCYMIWHFMCRIWYCANTCRLLWAAVPWKEIFANVYIHVLLVTVIWCSHSHQLHYAYLSRHNRLSNYRHNTHCRNTSVGSCANFPYPCEKKLQNFQRSVQCTFIRVGDQNNKLAKCWVNKDLSVFC